MKSRSKLEVDESTILELFRSAGIDGAGNIRSLGAGEYNSVYAAEAAGRQYAVKIAPADSSTALTYEQDMMAQEVHYYELMRGAGIRVPEIHHSDFSCRVIPAAWFIMDLAVGCQLDSPSLDDDARKMAETELATLVAHLHKVKVNEFGYRQCGLHGTWYDALHSMVENLLTDCRRLRRVSPRGRRLLRYIETNRRLLESVECTLINFDIWPPNIFVDAREGRRPELTWIDPERCLWGDRIADFVCLNFMTMKLEQKTEELNAYNRATGEPIHVGPGEEIRFAVMLGYLSLIMEVEKYARYGLFNFGYWRNVAVCRMLYRACFRTLKDLSDQRESRRS